MNAEILYQQVLKQMLKVTKLRRNTRQKKVYLFQTKSFLAQDSASLEKQK